MTMQFKKATKAAAKLRLGLTGPSGSGKTYTALAVGTQLGQKVGLLDTERGSASLYADRFAFEVLELPDFECWTYVKAIAAAREAGFDVLIVDSLSHAWEWLKDYVDSVAKAKYRGNTWSAWSEGTPIQNELVEAILQYPGHVLVTMRTKTEWETEKDANGKTKPVKIGLAPIQRAGLEYEFTVMLELSEGGLAKVGKTRWSEIADKVFEKPGTKFAKELLAWLGAGEAAPVDLVAKKRSLLEARATELPAESIEKFLGLVRGAQDLAELERLEAQLEAKLKKAAAAPNNSTLPDNAAAAPSPTSTAAPSVGGAYSVGDAAARKPAAAVEGSRTSSSAQPGQAVQATAVAAPAPAAGQLAAAMGIQPGSHELAPDPQSAVSPKAGGAAPQSHTAPPAPLSTPVPCKADQEDAKPAPTFRDSDRVLRAGPEEGAARVSGGPVPSGSVTVAELVDWIGENHVAHAEAAVKILADPKAHGPSETPAAIARLIKWGPRCQRFETVYEWWSAAGGTFTTGKDPKTKKPVKDFAPMDGVSFSDFWFGQVRPNAPVETAAAGTS
jgi:hypothetical protein